MGAIFPYGWNSNSKRELRRDVEMDSRGGCVRRVDVTGVRGGWPK